MSENFKKRPGCGSIQKGDCNNLKKYLQCLSVLSIIGATDRSLEIFIIEPWELKYIAKFVYFNKII